MAKTPSFFRHVARVTGLMAPAPVSKRYPYHDTDECVVGQEVKASGQWQYYKPARPEETREYCPACSELTPGGRMKDVVRLVPQ